MSDEFGFDQPEPRRAPDPQLALAKQDVSEFFETNATEVFYSRQVEVRLEEKYFHWITNRAIRELVAGGQINADTVQLKSGGDIHLLWHKKFRYYRRSAKRVVELVEAYSANEFARLVGYHAELLVIEGLARYRFDLIARNTREFAGNKWITSSHDLDFVYQKDGFAYGLEVKNSLAYMREDELNLKMNLCEHIGVTPLFVVRYMPTTWFYRVQQAGGFVLMLKHQLYPLSHVQLARTIREELGLPVEAPSALWDSTIERFTNWHDRRVNSLRNSQNTGVNPTQNE